MSAYGDVNYGDPLANADATAYDPTAYDPSLGMSATDYQAQYGVGTNAGGATTYNAGAAGASSGPSITDVFGGITAALGLAAQGYTAYQRATTPVRAPVAVAAQGMGISTPVFGVPLWAWGLGALALVIAAK